MGDLELAITPDVIRGFGIKQESVSNVKRNHGTK